MSSRNITDLYVETIGEGPPMLVMHGGPGLDHTYLRPALSDLSDRLQIIFYDHRGNGESADPSSWDEVTHETWVQDADALRESLGHERILLFGHSYGAFLALEYALRYPGQLLGLILCSVAPAMDYPDVISANLLQRGTPDQVEAAQVVFSDPVESDEALESLFLRILPLYFHRFEDAYLAQLKSVKYSGAAFNRAFFHCVPTYDVRSKLDEIEIPTLLLAGRTDWITPPAQGAERVHATMPQSELRIFEECGHFPFFEQPQEFHAAVTGWLSRHIWSPRVTWPSI